MTPATPNGSTTARWRAVSAAGDVAEAICALYDERGGARYDEVVSQTEHAVQCAEQAEREAAAPELVAAALLHDIGHLLLGEAGHRATSRDIDLHHETVAARFLSAWFDAAVTGPIALHVEAKRYLCAKDPAYAASLSDASVRSLGLQGGPMSAAEARRWERHAHAAAAIRLRRWDDLAKDPERRSTGVRAYAPLLARVASTAD